MTSFRSPEDYAPSPQTLDSLEEAILHASALPFGSTERRRSVAVYSDPETDVRVDTTLNEKVTVGNNDSREIYGNLRFSVGLPSLEVGVFDRDDPHYGLQTLDIQSRVSGLLDKGTDFEHAAWFHRAATLLDAPSDMVMQGIRRLVEETPFDVLDYTKRRLHVLSPDFILGYSRCNGNNYFNQQIRPAAGSDFAQETVSFTDRRADTEYRFKRFYDGGMVLYEGQRGIDDTKFEYYHKTGQLAVTERSAANFTQALRGATFLLRSA